MRIVAFLVGVCLAAGATGLLVSDAITTGHWTITHATQPLLVLGTVAAAVFAHKAPWVARPLFLVLAILGSLATLYGTLGRTSTARDTVQATAVATNEAIALKKEELAAARKEAARECTKLGERCKAWHSRIDTLTTELAQSHVVSPDPRTEAIVTW
jgi:hypothetical protein